MNNFEEVECIGNCNLCSMVDVCSMNTEPLTAEEYATASILDIQIVKDREHKPINMTRYIHNRPDKEAYTKARDRELDHARYWRNPEKRRKQALESYYKHRDEKLDKAKEYYQKNKEEIKAKRKAYYEAHKEEISRKRREEYRRNKNK